MTPFDRIGLIIFHFAWQAALIALITAFILLILKNAGSGIRYNICCISMFLMMSLPVYSAFGSLIKDPSDFNGAAGSELKPVHTKEVFNNSKLIAVQFRTDQVQISSFEEVIYYLNRYTPFISIFWMIGVIIITFYRIYGFSKVRSLVRQAPQGIDSFWEVRINEIIRKIGFNRELIILQILKLDTPAVIGFFKPVLLIPVSFLTGLETKYVEAVLLHELAHIKRYDYLINIIQLIIETLGFFHPAVWWLSGRIRRERENCCDDFAVEILGDKFIYAKSLVHLEEMRLSPSFISAANGSNLSQRISRLLGKKSKNNGSPLLHFAAAAIVSFLLVASLGFVIVKSNGEGLFSSLFSNAANRTLDDHLVAYFPFNGNANDESLFKQKTYTYNVTLCKDRFGHKNRAFDFNGKNSFICTNKKNVVNSAESITVSCWISPRRIKNWVSWVCKDGPKWASEWRVGFGENKNYEWGLTLCNIISGQNMWADYWISNTKLPLNNWTHVAVSADHDKKIITIYMNGKKIGMLKNLNPFDKSEGSIRIGSQIDDNVYFNGKIDDVRIYNRVLSDQEVRHIFELD